MSTAKDGVLEVATHGPPADYTKVYGGRQGRRVVIRLTGRFRRRTG